MKRKLRVLAGSASVALACLATAAAVSMAELARTRLGAYLQHDTRGPTYEMPPWTLVGMLWLVAILPVWRNKLRGNDVDAGARIWRRIVDVTALFAFLVNSLAMLGFLLTVFAAEPIQVKGLTSLSYALGALGAVAVALGLATLGIALMRHPKPNAEATPTAQL